MTWQTWIGMNGLKLVKEWLNTLTWMKDVKELTWRNWNDWTWTNCHEGIEWLILKNEWKWKNRHEKIETNVVTWLNGHEYMAKNNPRLTDFCNGYDMEFSLQSRAPLVDLIIQEYSDPDIFCFLCEIEISCAFCQDLQFFTIVMFY